MKQFKSIIHYNLNTKNTTTFYSKLILQLLQMRCVFTILFSIILSNQLYANGLGSWNVINLKYTVNNKWILFGEAQLRSLRFYHHFHYFECKGGFDFKAHKIVKLTLGMGNYQTYAEGGNFELPKNNNEFRIWPQVSLLSSIGKLNIEQRYRIELRFTSNGYRNRFRYRLGLSYPLGKELKGYKPFLLSLNNELFFTNREPYFERNRIQFTFNYKPSKNITLQVGYLHQFDYRINDEIGRDFFVIGFYYEFFRKKQADTTEADKATKD